MAGGDLAQDNRNAAITLNAISMRTNKGRGSNKVLSLSIPQYFYLYWYIAEAASSSTAVQ